MDSNEVLRYIYKYGIHSRAVASAISTDINLVALKVAHLATLGYNLHALEHKINFFEITHLRGSLDRLPLFVIQVCRRRLNNYQPTDDLLFFCRRPAGN